MQIINRSGYLCFIVLLMVAACTQYRTKTNIPDEVFLVSPPYQYLLDKFQKCRGTGRLISEGDKKGRLNFVFSCYKDSAYIQFKDLLGRRTIFMQIYSNDLKAWDIFNNKVHSYNGIIERFPFLQVVEPQDLIQILWGTIPEITENSENSEINFERSLTSVSFESDETEYGTLVKKAIFKKQDSLSNMEIIITEREFGSVYYQIHKTIPNFIPVF